MDRFSFVLVLLSVIVGLGLTELLSGVARQIKYRSGITHSFLQGMTVVIVMIALFQQWWESWSLQTVDSWSVGDMLLLLSGSIFLFLISHLLFPDRMENANLRAHYFANSRAVWSLAIVTVIVATAFRPLSFSYDVLALDNLSSFLALPVFVALAIFRSPRLHMILLPLLLITLILDILVFNPAI
jgi:hypothetical protein